MHEARSSLPGVRRLRRLFRRRRREDPRAFLLHLLPPGSVGAEIGVHQGDFSRQILDVARPRRLHLIDAWKYESDATYDRAWYGGEQGGSQQDMDRRYEGVCARFRGELDDGTVVIHRGYSQEVADDFGEGSLDWVYIDGNHLYDFVCQDLETYAGKVKEGGLITGDDYGEGGWWRGGVKRAVDEFVAGGPVEVVALRNRQYVLRKRAARPGGVSPAG